MFYSHSLLARKEPLGQIWMAATMHAKMNRRNLNQIDLIRICEEILNPRAPMALRLSSILMGGVVIVYERKVKLLFGTLPLLLLLLFLLLKFLQNQPCVPTISDVYFQFPHR
ncbi:putative rad21/Rec8-like protein [Rosa chinensis]|uniref:Putative rad21/Rec8-like protein n=1 Tax=Rosa chinensis TaxID=74649 RepID=A0A2P6SQY2_ROSCH|nr:putative rad21/Rec8-like protein [Rosa chinensis]PRQ61041.1 putative rad21/Rec8-like protein [Rosa chinensis]